MVPQCSFKQVFFLYIFLLVQTVDVGLLCLKLKVVNMDYKNIIFAFIKHDNILLLAHKMETSSLNWTCVYFNKRLILTCIFILLEVLYRFLCPALWYSVLFPPHPNLQTESCSTSALMLQHLLTPLCNVPTLCDKLPLNLSRTQKTPSHYWNCWSFSGGVTAPSSVSASFIYL